MYLLPHTISQHVQQALPLDTQPPTAGAGPPKAPPPQLAQDMHVEDLDLAPEEWPIIMWT